jgi:hypothetical protein
MFKLLRCVAPPVQPYMVLPGNHERDCHSDDCVNDLTLQKTFMNFTAYNTRFRMPAPESGACCDRSLVLVCTAPPPLSSRASSMFAAPARICGPPRKGVFHRGVCVCF